MGMRRVFTGIGLLLVLALASGMIWFVENKSTTTASPPVVICGQTLYSGAEGLPVDSPVAPSSVRQGRVNHLSSGATGRGRFVLVVLTQDCSRGVRFSIQPAGLVGIDYEIAASDRGAVALRLVGVQPGSAILTVLSDPHTGWRVPLIVDKGCPSAFPC